jgi:hypothetical protein
VKNKRERSWLESPLSVEKTNRLGSRDSVASGVKCRLHGGKNIETKSWTVSWLSLKTKPGRRGSQVMSGDWQRLHRVRGSLKWFTRKPLGYSVEPQTQGGRLDEEVRPPGPVQPPRRGSQTAGAGGSLTVRVAVAEKL